MLAAKPAWSRHGQGCQQAEQPSVACGAPPIAVRHLAGDCHVHLGQAHLEPHQLKQVGEVRVPTWLHPRFMTQQSQLT